MSGIQRTDSRKHGFTIVELLIVIVIIAILAAISVAVYNGIQVRANNTARVSEAQSWAKLLALYKAANGVWPAMTVGQEYCLGSGFPIGYGGVGRCHNYLTSDAPLQSSNTVMMSQLQTVGALPSGSRAPVASIVGPYARLNANGTINIDIVNQGLECPEGTSDLWNNGADSTCRILVH